jgi:RHS repeat-associated protein
MPDISLAVRRRVCRSHGDSLLQKDRKRSRRRFRNLVIESLETRVVMASDWQNPVHSLDVDNDNSVSPLDVLVVINAINQGNIGPFETINVADGYYLDADGDGQLSPLDVLAIINYLNNSSQDNGGGTSPDQGNTPVGFLAIPLRQLNGQTNEIVAISGQLVGGAIGFREMGVYVAESSNGHVGGLVPGQSGYNSAVLRSATKRVLYSSQSSNQVAANIEVNASSRLWLYVTQDTVTQPDPYRHVRVSSIAGDGIQIRWEETASSGFTSVIGDRGFDDAIVNLSFSAPFRRNTNPVLGNIPNQIVTEETSFAFRVTAMDQESLPSELRYSLLVSPSRATIDAVTGLISWLPEEQDGPGRFTFDVRVTDPQGGFASRSFFVDVVESNRRPMLIPIDSRTIQAGEAITIQMNATDQDLPRNTLSYSLHGSVPVGANINSQGRLTWVTSANTPSGSYQFNVRVTDNGVPPLSSETQIRIQVTSPRIDIVEDDRFITEHRVPVTLNANIAKLEIEFDGLQFDRRSRGMIRDAFEIALVNSTGMPASGIVSKEKDAFFNQTESLPTLIAANATHGVTEIGPADHGGKVTVDVAHLPDGFVGEVVFRLINNDQDNNTRVRINPQIKQISGAKRLSSSLAVQKPYLHVDHSAGLPMSQEDWLQAILLNNRFKVDYDYTTFNALTNVLTTGVTLTNVSDHAVPRPLWVSLHNITTSQANWENYSGRLPLSRGNGQSFSMEPLLGQPILNLSNTNLVQLNANDSDLFMEPGRSTRFTFDLLNDSVERFQYNLDWIGRLPSPPEITSSPASDVPADGQFSYQVSTTSSHDALTYSLISGPAAMVLDSESGLLTWNTTISDVGTHRVTVIVSDPFGGESTQTFTIEVFEPSLNRPPIWITYPVVDAFVNQQYLYPSQGYDLDHDVLEYRLVSGPVGFAINRDNGVASWLPKIEHLNQRFDVELQVFDKRGGFAAQSYTIQVNPNPANKPPVIISRPQVEYDLSSIGSVGFGTVSPRLIDLDLEPDEVARVPVSVVVESNIPKVDIFLLFDDTGSFASTAPQLSRLFPEVINRVTTNLPTVDFGFGVGRFEDYNTEPFGTPVDRPFILSQPILPLSHGNFAEAISAALNRYVPGFGNDVPESLVEALFQVATGAGFDGDFDGLTSGSGAAGQIGTQVTPGITGDVPSFQRILNDSLANESDMASFVPFGPGTRGGAGFRDGAISIILVATDAGIAYQPDNADQITGFQGIQIPTENFTTASRPQTPNGRGATIQQAIDALLAQNGLIVGLGTNRDNSNVPRRPLEAFALATGAVNRSNAAIDSNIEDDPILPGEPLYFRIACGVDGNEDAGDPLGEGESPVGDGGGGTEDSDGGEACGTTANEMLVNGVSIAIEAAVRSAPILVSLQSDDSQSIFRNLSGNVLGTNQGRSEFQAEFKGDGQSHRFELQFERVGTSELLGTIPVAINDRYRYDSKAIDPDGDNVTYSLAGVTHGAVIDSNSGNIRWRTTAPGVYSFTLVATDTHGATDTQSWSINVGDIRQDNKQPIIESIPDLVVVQGNSLRFDVLAHDPDDGDQLRFSISGTTAEQERILDGLSIISSSGRIQWTTTDLNIGQHQVFVRVTDGRGGVAEAPLRITVLPLGASLNNSPIITSEANPLAVVNETYRYRVTAFDRDSDPLDFQLLSYPAGMVIERSTGEIAWRPSNEDLGLHDVLFLVSDGRGGNASQSFSLFVQNANLPPVFDSEPVLEIGTNSTWRYQPSAVDPNGDNVTFSLLKAPPGMQMGTSGLLSYSSSVLGLHHVKILADDKKGGLAIQEFLLEVGNNTPPEFKSLPKTKTILGRDYRYAIDVVDADNDLISLSLAKSAIDAGLTLDGDILKWSPQSTGNFAVELFAKDEHGATAIQHFSILVVEPFDGNTAPEIISQALGPAMKDTLWTYSVKAFDLDDDPITFSLQAAPNNASIDSRTGVLHWLPINDGLFEFVVMASDSRGGKSEQKFSLTVLLNAPPYFTSTFEPTLVKNLLHHHKLVAVDPNPEDSISYRLATIQYLSDQTENFSIPQIESHTGILTWQPDTPGVYELIFEARDNRGAVASKREVVLITDPNLPNQNPSIVNTPRQLIQAERILLHQFIAIDPDHDDLTYRLVNGPGGMQLTNSGLLRWRPSLSDLTTGANPHSFTVEVSDGRGGKDSKSFFIDVTDQSVNSMPVITSTPRSNAIVAKSFEYQAIARDSDNDTLVWKLTAADGTSLPAVGATIDPSTGLFRWIPSVSQIGVHHFQISVFDPFGGIDRQNFSITVRGVNRPANIESNPPRIAVIDTEYIYDVRGVDPDLDAVSYGIVGTAPAGMILDRVTGRLSWTPKSIESLQVHVRAFDTFGAGTTQQVLIDVYTERPNSPPVFKPVNPGFAESGKTYRKSFVATDPDGDDITYRLDAPVPGMTVNSATGEVTWIPTASDIGKHITISLIATDERGKIGRYHTKIPVFAPNNPPVFVSQPEVVSIAGNIYRYGMRAEDADGDRLVFSLLTVPSQVTLDERTGQISWASRIEDAGKSFTFRVAVTDERVEQPVVQQWTVSLSADQTPPTVSLHIVGSDDDDFSFDPGTTLGFEVRVHDLGRIKTKRLLVNDQQISLNDNSFGQFTFTEPGAYQVTATAVDAFGNEGLTTREILVRNPNSSAPSLVIHSPSRGTVLTSPVPIRLSVSDSDDDLKTVRVFFAPIDRSIPFQLLAERSAAPGTTLSRIDAENIGLFDPTILANGEYLIRVVSTDGAFNQSIANTQVTVSGRLKLGNFTTNFSDLSLPSMSLPIEIQRRYDTLNANKIGDFGYGWNLEVKTVKSRVESETLGGPGLQGLRAFVDGTRVVITTPDGSEQGFTFRGIPDQTLFGIVLSWKAWFEPDNGNTFTLSSPASGLLKTGNEYISASGTTFNPAHSEFGNVLEAKSVIEKLKYRINARTGLSSTVIDRNGNSMTITEDGIFSSAGRSVLFDRDSLGRIVAITDPRGSTIRYEYDYAGNLTRVIDRMGDAMQFHYHSEPKHYLDRIVNQVGSTVLKARYTNVDFKNGSSSGQGGDGEQPPAQYGRLSSIEDANGVVTQLKFNSTKREQEIRNSDGLIAKITLDRLGNVVHTIDRSGIEFFRTYDLPEKGLVTSETMVVGAIDKNTNESDDLVTRYSYNSFGQVTQMVDYRGNETRYAYGRTGEPRSILTPEGVSTFFQFDADFNLIMQSSSEGTYSTISYDTAGRPIEIRSGRFEIFDGETNGSGSGLGDGGSDEGPQGSVLKIEYNTFGEISKLTDTDGKTRSNLYDPNGNLTISEFEWIDPDNINNRKLHSINNDHNRNDQRVGARNSTTSVSFELDAMRRISRSIDGDGFVSESRYNKTGAVVESRSQRTDQNGELQWFVSRFVYDDLGRVIYSTENVLESNANSGTSGSSALYDNLGRVVKSDVRRNLVIEITPDENNPLVYSSRLVNAGQAISATESTLDKLGREIEVKNQFGNRVQTLYDAYGHVIENRREVFDSSGKAAWLTSRVVYDSLGRVLAKTSEYPTEISVPIGGGVSPNVEASSYVYDSQGKVTNVISLIDVVIGISANNKGAFSFLSAAGSVISQTKKIYDSLGRLHKEVNSQGQITEYEYDLRNRRTATLGHPVPSQTVGLESQHPGLMVRTRNEVTSNEYGQMMRIRSNILQIENTTGLVVSIDRSKMHEVTQRFNAEGNLVESIFPDGTSIKSEYDSTGKVISETDQMGNVKRFEYDSSGVLSESMLPSFQAPNDQTITPTYRYAYDVQGLMVSLIDPLDQETKFTYSDRGLMTSRTLPSQDRETIEYNDKNRVVLNVSFEGIHQRTIYDETKIGEGRLLAREWFANATDYNAYRAAGGFNGNLPANTKWERLSFEYDIHGRITNQIQETFLGANNGVPAVVESRQIWTSEYNRNGLVTRMTGPTGFMAYEYDTLGRKIATVGGNKSGNALLRLEYKYDELGRLKSVSTVTRDGNLVDANANLAGYQPEKTRYHYDPFGRLAYVDLPNEVVEAYEFDLMGRLLNMRHYESDANNRDLSDNPKLSEFAYGYRGDGKRTSLVERFWNPSVGSHPTQENRYDWDYDPTGRLVREVLDSSDDSLDRSESFVMDATGNRVERRLDRPGTQNDRIEIYSYDVNDRVLAEYEYSVPLPISGEFVPDESKLIKSTSYEWNKTQQINKSEITRGVGKVTHAMEYDYQGKLASVAIHQFDENNAFVGGTKELYDYDQSGSRIVTKRLEKANTENSVWRESATIEYLVDAMNFTGYDQVVMESQVATDLGVSGGHPKFRRVSYVYGLDEITQTRLESSSIDGSGSEDSGATTATFAHDGHGSVRALIGADATPVQTFVYAAYGELLAVLNPTGMLLPVTALQTSMLYNGEAFSATTGLYNMRARWYDPSQGRFERLDPFSGSQNNPQSFHKYAFVHGDPIQNIDPTGEFSMANVTVTMGVIGGVIGGGFGYYGKGTATGILGGIVVGATIGVGAAYIGLFGATSFGAIASRAGAEFAIGLSGLGALSSLLLSLGIYADHTTSSQQLSSPPPETVRWDYQYAELALAVYDDDGTVATSHPVAGWTRLRFYEVDGYGYKAALYGNQTRSEAVLSYQGTNPSTFADWANNIVQGMGLFGDSIQYKLAKSNIWDARMIASQAGLNFVVTGHSLGGGLATSAAVESGVPAVVFNAAGTRYSLSQARYITNYRIRGEILSTLQDLTLLGLLMPNSTPGRTYWMKAISIDIVERHTADILPAMRGLF